MSNSKQLVRIIAKVHELAHKHDVQVRSTATLGRNIPAVIHFDFESEPLEAFTADLLPAIQAYKLYPAVIEGEDGSETLMIAFQESALRSLVEDDLEEKEEEKDQD